MAQYSKSPSSSKDSGSAGKGYAAPKGGQYVDRNLAGMAPEAAQEACKPTESEPVRMQTRMAGCS